MKKVLSPYHYRVLGFNFELSFEINTIDAMKITLYLCFFVVVFLLVVVFLFVFNNLALIMDYKIHFETLLL